ncbi:MAG: 5'(3')-deoxyribonucleotidase [Ferruginibacter sp.]|nr:5'(3')-deoxyribonucleotidase [Ferruginibacter sp.]
MKTIAVDMDGVIADVYSQFIKMHAAESGKVFSREEISGRPESEVFPNERKHVNSPGFFRNAPMIEDSQAVVERLNDHYKIFIVSGATEFPNSLMEKQLWLNEHFPFIGWQQMVFCGSKEIIKADIMIDDHFKNLDHFTGETFLFTQPHNKMADPGRHRRVESWQEIERLLLQ